MTSELETRLQTISQEILSRARLEELINRFGLYPDLRKQAPSEEVVERMRRDIQLEIKATDAQGRQAGHRRLRAQLPGPRSRRPWPSSPTPWPPSTSRRT